VGEIYSSTISVRIFFWVNVSVNECRVSQVFNVERASIGTALRMSHVSIKLFHICDFPTVSRVQHTYSSAAQWLLLPLYTKQCYNGVLILWYQNRGTAAWRLPRIERFTNGVRCKALIVENCNRKICRPIWDNDIKVDIPQIIFFKLRYFSSFKHKTFLVL
jgi:hypothetical protein